MLQKLASGTTAPSTGESILPLEMIPFAHLDLDVNDDSDITCNISLGRECLWFCFKLKPLCEDS